MKRLADDVLATAVIVLVAAVVLHLAWVTLKPFLWLVIVLVVVLAAVRFQRR